MQLQNPITAKMLAGIILGLISISPALAEEETSETTERAAWQERYQQADTDGDGRVSQEERKAFRETRREEMRARFDTDGDGELSDAEREVARETRRANFIKLYDKDGDGQLSDREKQAARKAQAKFRERREDFRDRQSSVAGTR